MVEICASVSPLKRSSFRLQTAWVYTASSLGNADGRLPTSPLRHSHPSVVDKAHHRSPSQHRGHGDFQQPTSDDDWQRQPSPARYVLRGQSMQHWYRRSDVQHTFGQGRDVNRRHSTVFAVHLLKRTSTTPTDVMGPNTWIGEVYGSRRHIGHRRGWQRTVTNNTEIPDVAHKSPACRHKHEQDNVELISLQITNTEPPDQQSCVTSAGDARRVTGGTRSSSASDFLRASWWSLHLPRTRTTTMPAPWHVDCTSIWACAVITGQRSWDQLRINHAMETEHTTSCCRRVPGEWRTDPGRRLHQHGARHQSARSTLS